MKQKILELKAQGKTPKEIAEIVGCSVMNVSYHCNPDVRKRVLESRTTSRRNLINNLKKEHGGKCIKCGYNKCLAALHFHHIDNNKSFGISSRSASIDDLRKEANKCILICANCHAEIHYLN